jgi:hypothetical protein
VYKNTPENTDCFRSPRFMKAIISPDSRNE